MIEAAPRRFFITGLPRSRTAWLASFFSFASIHCYHDAILGCYSLTDFVTKMNSTGHPIAGDSDSGLLCFAQQIKQRFPGAPLVVIDRNPADVQASLDRVGIRVDMTDALAWLQNAALKADLTLPFAALDDETHMRTLWQLCTDTSFPVRRWRAYRQRNIQVHIPTYKQRIVDSTHALLSLAREADPIPHGTL